LFGLVLGSLLVAVVIALIAAKKGRPALLWLCYGLLIWPVALIHVLLISSTPMAQAAKYGRVPCPFCAEMIWPQARVCPHCRRDLPRDANAPIIDGDAQANNSG
jgi:hypothetical protein